MKKSNRKVVTYVMVAAIFGGLLVSCTKEEEKFHILRADLGKMGEINTTENGNINLYEIIDTETNELVGYEYLLEANNNPAIHLSFRTKFLGQTVFDMSDVVKASIPVAASHYHYEAKALQMHLTSPTAPYIEGTFSGVFVRDCMEVIEGTSGYVAPLNDTIIIEDAYFKITPWYWE